MELEVKFETNDTRFSQNPQILMNELQIPRMFGSYFGPYFHLYVEMNICSLFDISVKDLQNGLQVKKAFQAKINQCQSREQNKDKVNYNVAYELMKNPSFKKCCNFETGELKAVISDEYRFLAHLLLICGEFRKIFYLPELGLLKLKNGLDDSIYHYKDSAERDFLYLAALCNYRNYAKKLLAWPIDINQKQVTGSTALHASAFFGHKEMTEILMKSGASVLVKNKDGSTPLDEANDKEILKIMQSYLADKLYQVIVDIRNHFPCGCQELYDESGKEIGFYVENPFPNPYAESKLEYDLETFHGTKLKNVVSIMKNGFVVPGETTKSGVKIKIMKGHISGHVTIDGFENFANAIFISRSPFYSGHPCYAEVVENRKKNYIVLLKLAVVAHAYSTHKATTYDKYSLKSGEDPNVELRVPYGKFIRIDGMYFLEQKHFLQIKNYGDFWKFYSLKKTLYYPSFEEVYEIKKYPFIKHIGVNESKADLVKLNINYQYHGQIFEFWVRIDCETESLDKMVRTKLGLPEKVFGLFFEGQYLNSEKNAGKMLFEFKIRHESVIYILFRNRGG